MERIKEISLKYGLSHNGSCLTAYPIIDEIYSIKKPDEPFVLSCGHAGLALYAILEKYHGFDADKLYLKHGTHPNRDLGDKIYCSTGSLGHGLPIACGMAMADRTKNVYCLISDGESFEGTIWETANIVDKYHLTNLKIYVNFNGWGAYDPITFKHIEKLQFIFPEINIIRTEVKDQSSHYTKL